MVVDGIKKINIRHIIQIGRIMTMTMTPFPATMCTRFKTLTYAQPGLDTFVANAGLMIHDGVGKYVLPSNYSVLVLSDRCQFGCHGEACECMGRT